MDGLLGAGVQAVGRLEPGPALTVARRRICRCRLTSTHLTERPRLGHSACLQVLQIACGGMHTVALTEDGQIFSWGVNDEGALGRETGAQLG